MYEPVWNMTSHQQHFQPLSPDLQIEPYPTNQPMSNVPYPSFSGQNEHEDFIRRVWLRSPPDQHFQSQQPYLFPSSKQNNKSCIPRTNPNQIRLPNLLESFSNPDNAKTNGMRNENAQNHMESQHDQDGLRFAANNILPVPLTIDPLATHDREFWNQYRQSSLTSNFFNGSAGLNLSGRPHTAGNLTSDVSHGIYTGSNGDDCVLASFPNGPSHHNGMPDSMHTRLPLPESDLLPAPTIKSDKIPTYSTDQVLGSWLNGTSSDVNCLHSSRNHSHVPQVSRNQFTGVMNPGMPFNPSHPLLSSDFHSHNWRVTTDIVLTAPEGNNGQHGPDIHYPSDPRSEDVWHSLQEPNAPEFPKLSAATVNHLQFYEYGQLQVPRDRIIPAPANDRVPGVMPYNSPPMESYFHLNPKNRPVRQDEKLRFPSDLYTPRWVRGDGPAREGFCSLCEDGNWLQLKTSQYWYHVRFTHGVNSNTGKIYDPPLRLRICDDPMASTFGFCGECHQWIPICTPRRKRCFTPWFKHAHACHRFQHSMGHYLPFQEEASEATPAMSADIDRMNVEDTSDHSAEEQDELISSPPPQVEQSIPYIDSEILIPGHPMQSFEKDRVPQRSSWPIPPAQVTAYDNNQSATLDGDLREQALQPPSSERTLGHRRSASEGWLGLQNTNPMINGSLINDVPHRPRAEASVKNPPSIVPKGQKALRSRKKQSCILKATKKK